MKFEHSFRFGFLLSLLVGLLFFWTHIAVAENEAALIAKVGVLDKYEDLRSFCNEVKNSNRPVNSILGVLSACANKLQILKLKEQADKEASEASSSSARLPALLREIRELPSNSESATRLSNLLSNNNYRLPGLSFSDQNTYYNEIRMRLGELGAGNADAKCMPVVSKIPVPNEIRDALIMDGINGISLISFLCGPLLVTSNVTVNTDSKDAVSIKIAEFSLAFARRRYLKDQRLEVALDSPIQGGVNALVLIGVSKDGRSIHIGNPNSFVVNFYSQFTPQLNAFLAQSPN